MFGRPWHCGGMRLGLRLVMPALLVTAACTGSSDRESERSPVTTADGGADERVETTPVPNAPGVGEQARDRIVVATADGRIYHVDPNGADRVDLVGEDEPVASQPVWSPDGRRLGWSQGDGAGFGITTSNIDGSEVRHAATPFNGYYGYWDPTSSLIGFLGNAAPGTGLVLDDGSGTAISRTVDSDTFYYFSWSPDGARWVVHSGSGMRIVGLDGERTTVDVDRAAFRAPTWAPDGTIILAVTRGDGSTIVRYDPETGDVEDLLDVGAVTNFVLDPTGRWLGIESIDIGASPDGDGEQRALRAQPAPSAEVIIYDITTGATEQALDSGSGGFWWSPDGTQLAILVGEVDGTALWNRWRVWSDGESFLTERFTITPTFAGAYVPFFDQFAQSVTPWSPDSGSFVYAGTDAAGASGVFVQRAEPETPARRITDDGVIAFWSPT
jgi:Tol biopolymer transport system component